MGLDLYGFLKGEFSANIRNFRPLWNPVSNSCLFTDEQSLRGCFNDYEEISKDECDHIIECLDVYLKNNSNPNHHLLMFYLFVKDSDGFMVG